MKPSAEWSARVGIAAALAALVAWSCWERWTMLTASPFPVGIDGYFYPVQLRSLLEHGTLAYPASPLAFWLMAPLAAVTDPITGAKLGAALFGALIALPAYGVGAQLGRSRGAGLVAAVLATTSAGSAFVTFEFVKNGVGLTVALTALWLVLRALDHPSRGRSAAALAGIAAAMLTHKMAGAIVLAIAVPAALAVTRERRIVAGVAALAAVALVLGVAFPERFLSHDDLALVARMWTADAHWDAPALVLPRATLAMGHEALIGGALAVIAAVVLVRDRGRSIDRGAGGPGHLGPRDLPRDRGARHSRGTRVAAWIVIGLGLALALPWLDVRDPMGLGFRLRIVAFVPMALCGAIVATSLVGVTRPLVRDAVLAIVALGIVIAMPRERTRGKIVAHPAMVAAIQALAIPDGATAIVPERHLMFMVAWYTRAPSRLAPDGVPRERRVRVMPLAFIGEGSPLDEALTAARAEPGVAAPRGTHPRHPNGLVLVTEPTWEWLLDRLPPPARDQFARWPTI